MPRGKSSHFLAKRSNHFHTVCDRKHGIVHLDVAVDDAMRMHDYHGFQETFHMAEIHAEFIRTLSDTS